MNAYRKSRAIVDQKKDSILIQNYREKNYVDFLKIYKCNDFSNVLEYCVDKYKLKSLCKIRNEKMKLKQHFETQENPIESLQ